jgi:predicted transcriptional regulator
MEEVWRQGETTVKRVMEALNRKTEPARLHHLHDSDAAAR